MLPKWAIGVKALLYPLECFYWHMSKRCGYQMEDDTWIIYGIRYSDEALRLLSKAQGETYKIKCVDNVVTLEVEVR